MRVTPAEVSQGQLTDEPLAEALRAMRDAGFVQLDGIFDLPYIEQFRDTFNDMLERYIAERGGLSGINKHWRRCTA